MFQSSCRRRALALATSVALAAFSTSLAFAADGYQTPPAPIAQILDSAPTPGVTLSPDRKVLAQLGRENLPSIAAVSEPILRLAGYRINPRNNGPIEARANWLNALSFEDVATGKSRPVSLPAGARFFGPSWSPDGGKLAFVMDAKTGLELWVADVKTATARKVTDPVVNATFGAGFDWLPDGSGLMVQTIVDGRGAPPAAAATPTGPTIQESKGRAAAIRTYQDLLANAHDEALFDYYFTSQLTRVSLDGKTSAVGKPGIISGVSISPDGQYLLINRLKRPYSYLVPANLFPTEIVVTTLDGAPVKMVADRPLGDNLPAAFDAVPTGPRSVNWRGDAPATLVWAEAQDGGEPRKKVAIHDSVYTLAAPFSAGPTKLIDLDQRYRGVTWGRPDFALVQSRWWQTRMEKRIAIDPAKPGTGRLLLERNYQDRYNDPGEALVRRDARGQALLHFTPDGKAVFVYGDGASAKGEFPFIGRMALADGKVSRLWQSGAAYYEQPIALADEAGKSVITRRESAKDPPNYYVHALAAGAKARALTAFPDRAPQFAGVTKQTITYQRADGVKLSGVLYLPAGYDKAKDGPLPLLMWAYPAEFTDAAVAGQTVDEGNRFTRPAGISHLFLLTQGYAVLDNPAFPIIGRNGAEPNDTYVEQLVADAQAAVDAVVALGVADRDRIAVGGHSYGAFMTANLLAHTRLFRAGIARSGAYNRTLTPFGFQAEQRTYWEATDTYTKMSPFTYAPNIKDPILLIHGEADDNQGTFPIQSERFYAALKGAGATVRYVTLPNEPHGYRALESTKHTLWEMTQWMDKYVKNAPKRDAK
ncbi:MULTISPECIES: prolyl oligopeptidase family serine peptidase [Caulobacter]|jgi:dipeptidyl aminopeptidase/acylaminoacyl peptidase|uniref:Glutamyl peptidase n=1 Tax=Caulobacter vibrioides OR37 TaxID=1292034 RepID=R0EJG7_CAUVI|nr:MULTISPECIES: prolyl oligopeptidase family serine peptidase [Caulobacter]ENZ81277.1 glutamyl peptidase [Caulobacter vibrioides OR37]MBQ1560020.1 S9 family peptidase [Caulobacter sp.]